MPAGKGIFSSELSAAWENHEHAFTDEDWYQPGDALPYFEEVTLPEKLDITRQYASTLAIVRAGAGLLSLKDKLIKAGHTNREKE
ncbi:hypothetical protein JMA_03310 [Jeotgalibacillus malaysiensis]|uniref:Uncharacterized protein n=1 Tax=Jeotgalibacillus malaysiensis TaxID=1508404 RepID=A0A0B5AM59_9BACL|nr:hypothetical protein [Jeotgalibacillus malaysiensis]AJD89648.1 hypothetical protein JMA_03310 [Jeotgalibacillus malaysiensis]